MDGCAELVAQLEYASATDGLLVGFPLRGSTAGVLYADQLGTDGPLDPAALRILTYVAAQALETLPLRRGSQTAPDDDAPAPEVEESTTAEQETEAAADESVEPAEAAMTTEVDIEEMFQEVEAAQQAQHEAVELRRDIVPPPFEPAEEPGAAESDEVEEGAPAGFETVVSELDSEVETPASETVASFDTVASETDADTELPDVELPAPEEAADIDLEDAGFATQESSTLEATLSQAVPEAPQPEPRPLEPAEVTPPADLDGPGWAFGGAGTITDDTRREEARRLARLLVTEIKLYNEEKVREGREQNNLVEQLRDDLERSRRIYDERIDEEIRSETDYFQEECLRILAGGDSTALGT